MYILFKRYGRKRNFKKYSSFEELNKEISRGHNPAFPGNNQFYYQTETREIDLLNARMTLEKCREDIEASSCLQ